ncbi:hypothetical protein S40288_11784 [Stachybotrys chartarum IBT 40288]|nr:hypothetical protein S40288_11784 [Stachybotrys chartarum IBT 40288]
MQRLGTNSIEAGD